MNSRKLSTSTPFTLSHYETDSEDLDSGYHSNFSGHHSNFSGHCSSVNNDSLLDNHRTKFYFVEKEHVDFLQHLGEKSSHTLIVKKILEYLKDDDLYNAANVSKTWKRIIISIPTYRRKLNLYLKKVESTKENRMVTKDNTREEKSVRSSGEEGNVAGSRSMLTEIQNKQLLNSNSPRYSASPSPSPRNRIEAFHLEAQRMKMGKRLYSCPKCSLPSQIDAEEVQTAVCTNSFCRYRFCVLCQCVVHPSRVCDFISTPVMRKQMILVGSRNSKRNLKRLLL